MVVGSFVLHLYCDIPDESHQHRGSAFAEFSGDTAGQARARARQSGWRFERGLLRVRCPSCVAARRTLPQDGDLCPA